VQNSLLITEENRRFEKFRLLKDRIFSYVMGLGGVAVIAAITLIFVFLFYSVFPLFTEAKVGDAKYYAPESSDDILYLALEEYAEIGLKVKSSSGYTFFDTGSGDNLLTGKILSENTSSLTAFSKGDLRTRVLLLGTSNGYAHVIRPDYDISYPNDLRQITPTMTSLFDPVLVDDSFAPIRLITGQSVEDETTIVAVSSDADVSILGLSVESSFLEEETSVSIERSALNFEGKMISQVAVDVEQRNLYVLFSDGTLELYDVADKTAPSLIDRVKAASGEAKVTTFEFLSGGLSIIIGDNAGNLSQWFPVRDKDNIYSLVRIREFAPMEGSVITIAAEYDRKGFAVGDSAGNFAMYHATAEQRVYFGARDGSVASSMSMSPRADAVIFGLPDRKIGIFEVYNEHPEVSFSGLWNSVWYESRQEPAFIWQSSASNNDFEPKFSLTPLAYGTLKATFYSMLFAIPLAVLGAIYTAYFMTPRMRAVVKPSLEIMAALPTVILGFLAGLWLAPLLEKKLPGFTLALLVMPLLVILAAYLWSRIPESWKRFNLEGWEALFLVPVLGLAAWLSLIMGDFIQVTFFNGSLTHWMSTEMGITYDQRNSLVVGMAIGFAVIPTIFSISEDAVFGVPRSLTMGSLALGATTWQTALRVVLLTASPGIFSAIMIGMGRAVGETMIVLMATGNTPIMDLNIFEGFRALSANIAVEMPEAEVASTHYRILFLAALVLFLVTFIVNTIAEVVRQRLREKYSSL
jgi:phosphate transport system permease protein